MKVEMERTKEEGEEMTEDDLEHLWSLLFADDNKLSSGVQKKVQRVLDAIYSWMDKNDMMVNSNKTFCLKIGMPGQKIPTQYTNPEGDNIKQVDSMQDLVVIFG